MGRCRSSVIIIALLLLALPNYGKASWQEVLESNFDIAETFDGLNDWSYTEAQCTMDCHTGLPTNSSDDSPSQWDYYSYWTASTNTEKWIADFGSGTHVGTSGKSLRLNITNYYPSATTAKTSISRLGLYFSDNNGYATSGAATDGYDELSLFFRVNIDSHTFPTRVFATNVATSTEHTLVFNSASGYAWVQSAGNASEYYLTATGGGNPGVKNPDTGSGEEEVAVKFGSSTSTTGTIGSLATGTHAFGRNAADSLAFDTLYVNYSSGTNPTGNFISYAWNPGWEFSTAHHFVWVQSAGNASEYYVRWDSETEPNPYLINPSLSDNKIKIKINANLDGVNVIASSGTIGSLLNNTYGYGKNAADNLTYDTVYVKYNNGANPDGYVSQYASSYPYGVARNEDIAANTYRYWYSWKFGSLSHGFTTSELWNNTPPASGVWAYPYGSISWVPHVTSQTIDGTKYLPTLGMEGHSYNSGWSYEYTPGGTFFDAAHTKEFPLDQWAGVEYYAKMNTGTNADGILRVWLYDADGTGTLVYENTSYMFRSENVSPGHKFNKWFFGGNNSYNWTGGGNMTADTYYDDFIIDNGTKGQIGPRYFALLNGRTITKGTSGGKTLTKGTSGGKSITFGQ